VNKRIERDEANKGGVNGKKNYPKRDKTQYSSGMRFDVVVVLGVHRSGTSALAKALELFGVDLGQNLTAPNEFNPKGYFEDNELVEINDRIFAKASNHWSSIQFLEPANLLGPKFEKEQKAAREFLKRKLAQGNPIGLKDPRLCRTLPLWEKIFVEMGIRVAYLMPFRNPFEVAASLQGRDNFTIDYGLMLWGSYETDALRHTAGKSRLFVGFHQLLENSGRELARMSEFLETAWNPDAQSNLEYEKKFLDSDLRHHQGNKRNDIEPAELQALAVALDKACQKSDKQSLEDVENTGREALLGMMQISNLIEKNNLFISSNSVEFFYSEDPGNFSEERKISEILDRTSDTTEVINVPLSGEVGLAPYWRLDPGCQPGMIHFLGMKFLDPKGRVVWDLQDHREQVLVQGTGLNLPFPPVGVEVVSTGNDPIIILPALPADALPIASIHVNIEIITTQEEIARLVELQAQKVTHLLQAVGEKDLQVEQIKTSLDAKDKEIAKATKIGEKIEQIRQEMAADRKESKLVVKKVEEVRATSEQQNVSLQNTLSQIRQEMAVDREESKLAVKKVEKGWTQQRKAQQEAVEKSVVEVKKEIVAEIQSLIANLVEQEEKNRLEVSARIDSVKEGLVGRISEVGEYAAEIQKAAVSPSSYLIPAPFSWYSFLYKMLNIREPVWLNKEERSREAPKRPGFWRRLERSIRKRRKRWIGGVGFERDWYLREYPDVAREGIDPLDHYIQFGIQEGRWKSKRHKESNKFLQKKMPWSFDRISFDSSWYLKQYPDVAAAGLDAYWHYKNQGIKEGRFKNRKEEKKAQLFSGSIKQKIDIIRDSKFGDSSRLEVFIPSDSLHGSGTVQTDIRAIALYLPQFHAIPENDDWWGKGFTEWTNVRRGKPHYEGHYQPHVPQQDLGYYDLNDPSVMEKQAAMAKVAGIEGFCFYYYWFNGKRLLNMPTDRMLATGKPDFPFCFCWANENWTRTWDGGDNEILMAQKHSAENDEGFICDLLQAFRDRRYIRVAGKPLLVVYRPGLLPNVRRTTDRWREICRKEGIGEIHLAFMLGFEDLDPTSIGFDSAIQMPPLRAPLPDLKKELKIEKPEIFKGEVRDYLGLQRCFNPIQISKSTWPAVCPSWDNTARKMERAHSWIRSSPRNYLTWLQEVVEFLRKNRPAGERIVFINAWNEWGEGCHLEPDEKYGYAWLNATRFALTDIKPSDVAGRLRVLVVGHDAWRNGAQILLLTMLREWKKRDDVDFRVILLGDGPLRSDFQKICPTMLLTDYPTEGDRKEALQEFDEFRPDVILANTAVSGPILPTLKSLGVPIVSYIHELQKSIERWAPGPIMAATVSNSDHFIAVSKPVEENLIRNHGAPSAIISCQNPYIKTSYPLHLDRLRNFRSELGVQRGEKIVFGCGTPDWRKGADIFGQVAENVIQRFRKVHFIWIGADRLEAGLKALPHNPRIRFIGEREFPRDYLPLGDVFFLPSREDPFPLVALEAADAGLPIVCFADAGGMPEFVGNTCGRTVPLENAIEAGNSILEILRSDVLRESLGKAAQKSVRTKHDAVRGSGQILSILKQVVCEKAKNPAKRLGRKPNPLVSVIVPNYNHARLLPERISSITKQTYGNIEIIILDDKSTDESIEIIQEFIAEDTRARCLKNEVNSGSSFKQWRKGLREAKGKYVWIAESDDSAHPELVQTLVARLEANDKAVLATCCPRMTSLDGDDLGIPRDWFADIGGKRWESDFSSTGKQMIAEVLSKKNAILNASGVVFRNRLGLDELADTEMRLCGDWLFWVRLLARGEFEYVARPLNYWRLGSSNARTKPAGEIEWREGSKVLREIAKILGLTEKEESEVLALFKKKCDHWKKSSKTSKSRFAEKH